LVETSCRNACHGSKRHRARIKGLTEGLEKEKMQEMISKLAAKERVCG
jgi:hypothetical protein